MLLLLYPAWAGEAPAPTPRPDGGKPFAVPKFIYREQIERKKAAERDEMYRNLALFLLMTEY